MCMPAPKKSSVAPKAPELLIPPPEKAPTAPKPAGGEKKKKKSASKGTKSLRKDRNTGLNIPV